MTRVLSRRLTMLYDENDGSYLSHVGKDHIETKSDGGGSGRYRFGSGKNPFQHEASFISRYNYMKSKGMTDKEIAEAMSPDPNHPVSIKSIKDRAALARAEEKYHEAQMIRKLVAEGKTNKEIAEIMGYPNESSVRSKRDRLEKYENNATFKLAEQIKQRLDETGMLDIGAGVEYELGVTRNRLDQAVQYLADQGYNVYNLKVKQPLDMSKETTVKTLCKEDVDWAYATNHVEDIQPMNIHMSMDGDPHALVPPVSFDSKRIQIAYDSPSDGLIEMRPGVKELTMEGKQYAQVRIAVDGSHYLKGMAVYNPDLPPGVDIRFNTNKKPGTPMINNDPDGKQVLKPLESDPENPFGAYIHRQNWYTDANGERKLGVVNIIKETGDWDNYSKCLPSQMLSKQSIELIKDQLSISIQEKLQLKESIDSIKQPTVRRALLEEFATDCDGSAVDLKAAALPRQSSKVLLPIPTLKENECYAPTYKDGTKLALIRYPHESITQIPVLTVNNKNKQAQKLMGNAPDAIGIGSKPANQLSGADFDGDSVTVIPCNGRGVTTKISARPQLKDLVGYDPSDVYAGYPGMKVMSEEYKQRQMGVASNLLTDMQLFGADDKEVARAIKYSMCVIDAHKHKLDYKRCYKQNDIAELQKKYQKDKNNGVGGAATIISKSKRQVDNILERDRVRPSDIDPKTGEIHYRNTNRTYSKYDEKTKSWIRVAATQSSTEMAEAKDAFDLVSKSNNIKERAYATYANAMKKQANATRKQTLAIKDNPVDKKAKAIYADEVERLERELKKAEMNAPKERDAQIRTAAKVKELRKSGEADHFGKEEWTDFKARTLAQERLRVGANKKNVQVVLTQRSWEAIQHNALSGAKIRRIIANCDKDKLKEFAIPRQQQVALTPAKVAAIKAMANATAAHYTIADIAERMGVSESSVKNALNLSKQK